MFLRAVLARHRRTVTTWIRTSRVGDRFDSCYITAVAAGNRTDRIAATLPTGIVGPFHAEADRQALALDDTPTRRYRLHVHRGHIRHNLKPGRTGPPFVPGNVFVVRGLFFSGLG
jgi:hypothetical protein